VLGIVLAAGLSCTITSEDPTEPETPTNTSLVLKKNEGQFVDSAVKGLQFRTDTKSSMTTSTGIFTFETGKPVEFYVGDIVLGSADPEKRITPVILGKGTDVTDPTVTNIARFLQTIDNDATPSNGINIVGGVRNEAMGKSINFAQPIADFENDANVIAVVSALTAKTDAGTRPLIDTITAQSNLYNGVRAAYVGQYSGKYCIVDSEGATHPGGDWAMTINTLGKAKFEFVGAQNFKVTCAMALTGHVNAEAPELKIQICGSFAPGFKGRWTHGNASGTFSEGSSCVSLAETECTD
jgi:hypothetical protein